jgi:hypothetical protein
MFERYVASVLYRCYKSSSGYCIYIYIYYPSPRANPRTPESPRLRACPLVPARTRGNQPGNGVPCPTFLGEEPVVDHALQARRRSRPYTGETMPRHRRGRYWGGGHLGGADPPGSPSSSSSLRPAPLFILADGRRRVNRASSQEAGGRRWHELGRPRSPRRQCRGGHRDAANPPLPRNLLAETAHQV